MCSVSVDLKGHTTTQIYGRSKEEGAQASQTIHTKLE